MAYHPIDRISSTDAGFLHQEDPSAHMHIGGLTIFRGPTPEPAQMLDRVRSRLHLIPRYRQRLQRTPPGAGRPAWVDDPNFNVEFHIHQLALPAPGGMNELLALTGHVMSLGLDRSKALWELWVVGGLAPEAGDSEPCFAVISKTHHTLIDGLGGIDIAQAILDQPDGFEPATTAALRPWHPHPEPSTAELLLDQARTTAGAVLDSGLNLLDALRNPREAALRLLETASGLGEVAWAVVNPAPETVLNLPIGPYRRYSVLSQPLADYQAIKDRFGGTINDVFLAAVTGGLAHLLDSRGLQTAGVEYSALVPISVRREGEHGAIGNRLTVLRAPLPIYATNPLTRLQTVISEMRTLKASRFPAGALTVSVLSDAAPAAVVAQTSRLQFSSHLFNLLVTNVPGPQHELRLLGRPALHAFPLPFLAKHQALAIAIISYNGRVELGLLGDYDALPDLDVIGEGIELALRQMLALPEPQADPATAELGSEPASDLRAPR
jgi:diacylglycerol O-acyltransferase